MGARKSIAGENVTINLALWKSSQTFRCRRCVNERERERARLKKETQFIFNFALTMCQETQKDEGSGEKLLERSDERESRVTKLGIRFPFILVCMLLDGFCDLLRLVNDNYPRRMLCDVVKRHLAFGTWSTSFLFFFCPAEWRCRFQLVSYCFDTVLLIPFCFPW